jgi:hypothetical protein
MTTGERKKQSEVPQEGRDAPHSQTLTGLFNHLAHRRPGPNYSHYQNKQANMGFMLAPRSKSKQTTEPNDSYLNHFCAQQCWKP